MDMQPAVVDRYTNTPAVLEQIGAAIEAARATAIPVIYVVVGFREGRPEMNPRNKIFSAGGPPTGTVHEASPAEAVHPAIAPQSGDIVVRKRRISAFAGSDLDIILRAQDIKHLVLSGIATSGVVLSTLRYAADLDFRLSVLSDGCTDNDVEVHRVLTEKIFPSQATVLTVDEWKSTL